MKPITKKIIESGLVDKHTARLMEKWGTLEQGASDSVGLQQVSADTLMEFASDIEELLDEEGDAFRETRLSIEIGDPFLVDILLKDGRVRVAVHQDKEGNYMFPSSSLLDLHVGGYFSVVAAEESSSSALEIEEIAPLYLDNHIYAVQVRAVKKTLLLKK